MNKKHKQGLIKGFVLFGLFLLFVFISSDYENLVGVKGGSGIMWFITFSLFIGSILLISISWGAHLKLKMKLGEKKNGKNS